MSIPYTMDPGLRAAMAPHHRLVQAAIAVLANKTLGVSPSDALGINKFEGGVSVNAREICIRQGNVADDFSAEQTGGSPEELAVASAIGRVECLYQHGGLTALRGIVLSARGTQGDPLRRMFALQD